MKNSLLKAGQSGIRIYLENGKLKYRIPGSLKEEQKTWLKKHKDQICSYLQRNVLKVRSEVLMEDIYFIPDPDHAHLVPPGNASYTLKELESLVLVWPERKLIQMAHEIKKELNGKIIY